MIKNGTNLGSEVPLVFTKNTYNCLTSLRQRHMPQHPRQRLDHFRDLGFMRLLLVSAESLAVPGRGGKEHVHARSGGRHDVLVGTEGEQGHQPVQAPVGVLRKTRCNRAQTLDRSHSNALGARMHAFLFRLNKSANSCIHPSIA